jgi:two-component system sensor histidine kinase UhpB
MHVRSITETVGRIQRHVRAILGRLRPLQNIELKTAIDRVVTFWRTRRPDVAFTVAITVEQDRIDDDMRETIYRVIQEGTSNAIRHGAPTQVQVTIAQDGDDFMRVEVADDGVGMPVDGKLEREPTQFGLKGMRERIMAMAGSLSIQRGPGGKGLALVVRLPCMKSPQYRSQDALE